MLLQALELAYLTTQERLLYPVVCGALFAISAYIFLRFRRAQRLKVMQLVNATRVVPIVSSGVVRAVSSHRLVPGDVIVLQRGKAACDMVLLRGACLVIEATLSGEVQPSLRPCSAVTHVSCYPYVRSCCAHHVQYSRVLNWPYGRTAKWHGAIGHVQGLGAWTKYSGYSHDPA